MRRFVFFIALAMLMAGCNKPSKVDQYHAEKHVRDSIALSDQQRSLAFYQAQLDTLMPVADSLLPLFQYEKNEKYQDHGVYVVKHSAVSRLSEKREIPGPRSVCGEAFCRQPSVGKTRNTRTTECMW